MFFLVMYLKTMSLNILKIIKNPPITEYSDKWLNQCPWRCLDIINEDPIFPSPTSHMLRSFGFSSLI